MLAKLGLGDTIVVDHLHLSVFFVFGRDAERDLAHVEKLVVVGFELLESLFFAGLFPFLFQSLLLHREFEIIKLFLHPPIHFSASRPAQQHRLTHLPLFPLSLDLLQPEPVLLHKAHLLFAQMRFHAVGFSSAADEL